MDVFGLATITNFSGSNFILPMDMSEEHRDISLSMPNFAFSTTAAFTEHNGRVIRPRSDG